MQLRTGCTNRSAHIVARGERICAEFMRERKKVAELDPLVATHAGDRRLALGVAFSKIIDHRTAKPLFVVEHVMRDTETLCHTPGIVNILPGTTRTFLL